MAEQQFLPILKQSEQIEQVEKANIDMVINQFIETHRQNHTYMTQLTIESVTALTSGDARAKALSRQNFVERFWYLLTGRNQQVHAEIHRDFTRTQYASQQLIQQLAAQNLMTFELVTAVNNKLNTLILEQDQEINDIYQKLGQFFKQIRANLACIEDRLDKLERNVDLLHWSQSIEFRLYEGREYAHLSDVEKIICVTTDFFKLTRGIWNTLDVMLLKKTLTEVELPVKNMISLRQFFAELLSKPPMVSRLFENLTKDGLRILQAYDTPLFKGIEKLERLNNREAYMVETVAETLTRHSVVCSQEEIQLSLVQNYLKQEAYSQIEKEINLFDLVLDILNGLRMISDVNRMSHEKSAKHKQPPNDLPQNMPQTKPMPKRQPPDMDRIVLGEWIISQKLEFSTHLIGYLNVTERVDDSEYQGNLQINLDGDKFTQEVIVKIDVLGTTVLTEETQRKERFTQQVAFSVEGTEIVIGYAKRPVRPWLPENYRFELGKDRDGDFILTEHADNPKVFEGHVSLRKGRKITIGNTQDSKPQVNKLWGYI